MEVFWPIVYIDMDCTYGVGQDHHSK